MPTMLHMTCHLPYQPHPETSRIILMARNPSACSVQQGIDKTTWQPSSYCKAYTFGMQALQSKADPTKLGIMPVQPCLPFYEPAVLQH
jgi:hypothetical protein